jgi:DNA polymerase-2
MGVCAFGRDILLKAFSIAKNHGFEVVHGIVDSLWLKNPDATNQEYEALCETISTQVGVPINFEGRYKWIVFMPSKNYPQIGVLNRYYGVLENGKVKVRGLEVRRRDTPRFVSDAQTDMINSLSHAENSYELRYKIPEALDVVKEYRRRLLDGEIPVWDLIITKRLSKNPDKYKQQVSQLIAAKQLIREGLEVHAGNNIKFLFTHAEDKRYDRRVKAAQLIDENVNPDLKKYLLFLYSSAANLLSFSGFTTKSIYDVIKGNNQESLLAY